MTAQVIIGKILGVIKSINYSHLISFLNRFKFSITIVPEGTSYISAKRYSFGRIALFLFIFGGLSIIINGILMVYTPLNQFFFSQSYQLSHHQVEDLKKLDKQIEYLVKETEKLRQNNQRLQKAIELGDSNALKEFKIKPAPKSGYQKPGSGGNILEALRYYLYGAAPEEGRGSVTFRRPCDGFTTNRFSPVDGHYGIDYSLNTGAPVYAAANGYVVFSDYTADDGNMVILVHGEGYVTVYKHCFQLTKKARQTVLQGELIALSGGTGRLANGPHLHFEIWKDGISLNPELLLISN